jgi:hypothetical protein
MMFSPCVDAVTIDDAKKSVAIAVAVPKQVDNLDEGQLMRIGNITLDLATRSGISATVAGSPIVMMPVFTIAKEDVVETGMKNLIVIDADITFIIKNIESEVIYSSLNSRVRGSGASRQRAITEAISKIQVKSAELTKFIERGREKILDYYRNNCAAIMLQAETLAKTQQYEEAFALIASVPYVAACFSQSQTILEKYYPNYLKQNCNELLNKARTYYGVHDYVNSMAVLYDLKTFGTDCNSEVLKLITDVESKMTDDEQRTWDFIVQRDNNRTALAEKRLETLQVIAIAYYGRRMSDVYNVLIH